MWLLRLLDLGVDSIMCTDHKVKKLASITTHPTLHQWLQNSLRNGRGQGSDSLLEWVMAAICIVWADAGVMPDTEDMAVLRGLRADSTGFGHACLGTVHV